MNHLLLTDDNSDVRPLGLFRQWEYLLDVASVREPDHFDTQVQGVATLGEPVRRALYRYVVAQPEPVGREQAAAGTGVARHVAKFHLDKLVADGLLTVEYRRPPDRRGPGAGRPAKLYRRAEREIAVSLPPRRYDLAAQVLAAAMVSASQTGAPPAEALRQVARETGRTLGVQGRAAASGRGGRSATARALARILETNGYEPRPDAGGITLVNCPFHNLSRDYTELVCDMNFQLVDALVESIGDSRLRAELDPAPHRCCVRIGKVDG